VVVAPAAVGSTFRERDLRFPCDDQPEVVTQTFLRKKPQKKMTDKDEYNFSFVAMGHMRT
jgi:hypothetical protein